LDKKGDRLIGSKKEINITEINADRLLQLRAIEKAKWVAYI